MMHGQINIRFINKIVPHVVKVFVRISNFKYLTAEEFSVKIRDQSNEYGLL